MHKFDQKLDQEKEKYIKNVKLILIYVDREKISNDEAIKMIRKLSVAMEKLNRAHNEFMKMTEGVPSDENSKDTNNAQIKS